MTGHGFKFKPTEEGEWHVGSGLARERFGGIQELMPNGHGWKKYVPEGEKQNNGLETMACTIFGSLNALETLANYHGMKDFPKDCSERFSAILAKITPTGADPQTSCEAIRRWGVIPEGVLPFNEDIKTWPNFYHPDPMEEAFIKLGQDLLKKYVIGHEYVFNGGTGITPKADRLISALSRGTVCVSVCAWKERNGLYYKNPQDYDNHWVHLVDYKMGDYWVIRDSYSPFTKKIEWDTNFQTAKLYFLSANESGRTPNQGDFIIKLLMEIIRLLKLKQFASWLGFGK